MIKNPLSIKSLFRFKSSGFELWEAYDYKYDHKAWLGGRVRAPNNKWTYVNGQTVPENIVNKLSLRSKKKHLLLCIAVASLCRYNKNHNTGVSQKVVIQDVMLSSPFD